MNDIDKLDGMIKIKGKCGYEIIGGCKELRKYKQALEEIRERFFSISKTMPNMNKTASDIICDMLDEYNKLHIDILTIINEVLNEK